MIPLPIYFNWPTKPLLFPPAGVFFVPEDNRYGPVHTEVPYLF